MTIRNSRLTCITAAFIAGLFVAACHSTPPARPASITFNDTQTLPAGALKARALAQLDALLTPAPPPPRSIRFNTPGRFDSLWLATTPRLDLGVGMCRYDLLQLGMRPDPDTSEPDGNTPTRATSVAATTWFSPASEGATDCTGHNPAAHNYFETDAPLDAGQDFAMLKDVLARLDTAAPGFDIACDSPSGCAQIRARANAATLLDIGNCAITRANAECRHFSWRDPEYVELYITFETTTLNRRVLSIRFDSGIIL